MHDDCVLISDGGQTDTRHKTGLTKSFFGTHTDICSRGHCTRFSLIAVKCVHKPLRNTMELRGKGVFITGAATGIGRALLPSLLDRGARVLFCDVNEEAGRRARDELLLKYGESDVIFMQCDVSDAKQLTEAFQRAVNEFRAVEICINNAAIMDERVWEKMIDINQVGVIRGSNLALEHMRRDKGGRGGVIINTASVNGLYYGQWMFPVYMCTKKAIVGFTTSWANSPEQEQHGVRWGVVCPDGTATPLTD
ncbi:15-hydroxyprostaglandin dehydrogenase [NAD(+)]-like [Littorina saxatilis]|uniref:15-hydroxyprostaglandin dehydrogenase [NAD(+)]-like n=1 Tax=Littorina saxatilis TaxID=31220 RepID=UPI0038B55B90